MQLNDPTIPTAATRSALCRALFVTRNYIPVACLPSDFQEEVAGRTQGGKHVQAIVSK